MNNLLPIVSSVNAFSCVVLIPLEIVSNREVKILQLQDSLGRTRIQVSFLTIFLRNKSRERERRFAVSFKL